MAWAHLTVTQHVLIKMIFGIFAVSCTVHVNVITFLPHLKLSSTAKLVLGLPRPFIEVLTKTFHPPTPLQGHHFFQVFEEKKKK